MIQSSIARTRRYNARPPSHPVERVVTMHPLKVLHQQVYQGSAPGAVPYKRRVVAEEQTDPLLGGA